MRPELVYRRLTGIGLALALLALAGCGGGGGSGSSTPPPPGSKLFIVDAGNHAIASAINAAPTLMSPLSIDRTVQGSSTGLGVAGGTPSISSIPSIALDAATDRLFAATQGSVAVFDNISTADGNAPYSRLISATLGSGGTLRGVNFYGLYLDTANDRLYSVDPQGEVHVFNSAHNRNGATTPDRTVTPDLGGTTVVVVTFGIAVDKTRDLLYVGIAPSGANPFIIAFDGAAAANTPPNTTRAPDRTISLPGAGAFYLDEANDRLYVAQFNGQFLVFNSASTLAAAPAANRTITFAVSTTQNFIFVDTIRDKLYAVNNNSNGNTSDLLIVDNASTTSDAGPVLPMGTRVVITLTNIRLSAVAVKP